MSIADVDYEIDPGVQELIDEVLPGWIEADKKVLELTQAMLSATDETEFNELIENARIACATRDGVEPEEVTDEILAQSIDSATWFLSDREGFDQHYLSKAFADPR